MADIPVCVTPFRIQPATDPKTGRKGHKAVWIPRTKRHTDTNLDASPVLDGGPDRVRTYMTYCFADVREVRGKPIEPQS